MTTHKKFQIVRQRLWLANADDRKERIGRTHSAVSPQSVLVAGIGNHWLPGCLESIVAMCEEAAGKGYDICFYEETDRCYRWGDAIGSMRNMAYRKALAEGWEWIMYIDNDVIVPPDTIERMINHHMPIVVPIVVYADGDDHGLEIPHMERNKGLAVVASSVISCIMFRTLVFAQWAIADFWGNAIGDDEGYHMTKLALAGHQVYCDTALVVTCQKPPKFPFDRKDEIRWAEELTEEKLRAIIRDEIKRNHKP